MDPVEAPFLSAFRQRGVLTARELARERGVSQPTISRLVSRLGVQRVVRIAGGRSTRYGLRRQVRQCQPFSARVTPAALGSGV